MITIYLITEIGEAPPAKFPVTHTAEAPDPAAAIASSGVIIPRTIIGRPVSFLSYVTYSNLKYVGYFFSI